MDPLRLSCNLTTSGIPTEAHGKSYFLSLNNPIVIVRGTNIFVSLTSVSGLGTRAQTFYK